MLAPLTNEQQAWVDATLTGMTLEQCAGQLLCPMDMRATTESWLELLDQVPLGSIFIRSMPGEELRRLLAAVQEKSAIPIVVAADLEHGAQAITDVGTVFPWPMAAGAANDVTLMRKMGQATAVEARYHGLHWTFGPVMDLNLNFNNPITNVRAMGDDPDRVIKLGVPLIEALQSGGRLAATAKHFPGDGVDDRDHHIVGSVNTLPVEQWRATFGRVFKAAVEAGVLAVMPGHISLPDYQGYAHAPDDAPPATLSRDLLDGLLRRELGFDGLIVSDASPMIGLQSRVSSEASVVQSIDAGIDMYLFPDPVDDYRRILAAVSTSALSEDRIREAARRVLEFKARLNLHVDPFGPEPSDADRKACQAAAEAMAEKGITLMRNDGLLPLELAPGAKVLTVTIGQINEMLGAKDLTVVDKELQQRGYAVTHLLNPTNDELRSHAAKHDVTLINVYTLPFAVMGTVRTVVGHLSSWAWRSIFTDNPRTLYTAFGNPYLLYEAPHLPNLVATYGATDEQQRAAVRAWLGAIEAKGNCPVKLPRTTVQPWPGLGA